MKKEHELPILQEINGDDVALNGILSSIKEAAGIDVSMKVQSGGGSVFEGLAIHSTLASYSGNVRVEILGLAASMATVIPMAADEVCMSENGFFMIHDPLTFTFGNIDDHEGNLNLLKMLKAQMIRIYDKKTGLGEAKISAMMTAETWLTAKKAKGFGFVDRLLPECKIDAVADLSTYKNVPKELIDAGYKINTDKGGEANSGAGDSRKIESKKSKEGKMTNTFNWMKSLFVKDGEDPENLTDAEAKANFMANISVDINATVKAAIKSEFEAYKSEMNTKVDAQAKSIKAINEKIEAKDKVIEEMAKANAELSKTVEALVEQAKGFESNNKEVNTQMAKFTLAKVPSGGASDASADILDVDGNVTSLSEADWKKNVGEAL